MNNIQIKTIFHIDAEIQSAYRSFNGRRIVFGCANVHVFDTLMRAGEYILHEPACESVNFDAERNNGEHVVVTFGMDKRKIGFEMSSYIA